MESNHCGTRSETKHPIIYRLENVSTKERLLAPWDRKL